MEVYKYITSAHYERVKFLGRLDPRREDGFTYGIPDNPFLWGEQTQEITNHLQKYGGAFPIILLRIIINNSDPNAFVQEGNEFVWSKEDTRKPLACYRREDYELPEVVIKRSVPFEEISVMGPIPGPQ